MAPVLPFVLSDNTFNRIDVLLKYYILSFFWYCDIMVE